MENLSLPRVLEQTLHSYLCEYPLTSWKICSGKSHTATVIIRFGYVSQNQHVQPDTVTYRKKPPSAQNRDQQRIEQHISDIEKGNQVPQHFNNAREFIPGASMHECTSELQPRIEEPRNMNGDLENEVTITNKACAAVDVTPLILKENDDMNKVTNSLDESKDHSGKDN